jgi:hypothetical protein
VRFAPAASATDVDFGDVFQVEWLDAVYVASNSSRLKNVTVKGIGVMLRPAERHESSERWLTYSGRRSSARNPSCAVVVSDECHIEKVTKGYGGSAAPGGRLVMVPIRIASAQEASMANAFGREVVEVDSYTALGLEQSKHFVLDLNEAFNVKIERASVDNFVGARIAKATDPEALHRRWCAFTARRGPLAIELSTQQIYSAIEGSPGELPALFALLSTAWSIEGSLDTAVADHAAAIEAGRPAPFSRGQWLEALESAFAALEKALEDARFEHSSLAQPLPKPVGLWRRLTSRARRPQ